MEALSREDVIGKLQEAGNLPLDAREAEAGGIGGGLDALFKRAPLSGSEQVSFTQQLATLMGAGQPLDRALQILVDLPDNERARKLIERSARRCAAAPRCRPRWSSSTACSRAFTSTWCARARSRVRCESRSSGWPSTWSVARGARQRDQRADVSRDPDDPGGAGAGAADGLRGAAVRAAVRGHGPELPWYTQVVLWIGEFLARGGGAGAGGVVAFGMAAARRFADPRARLG